MGVTRRLRNLKFDKNIIIEDLDECGKRMFEKMNHDCESFDHRKFVEEIESGRSRITSWDVDISWDEYVRRVKEGYYDNK